MYTLSPMPLKTAEAIGARVQELGQAISVEYDFDMVISVLTGSFVFTADLCRAFALGEKNTQREIRFIKASSYGNSNVSSGELKVSGMESLDLKEKKILLVDDILDTGRTLLALVGLIKSQGAAEVRSCVLLDKPSRRQVHMEADYCGFEIDDLFVVGYGLDYSDKYRLLPDIWTLKNS